jgi:hypothetical protein
MSNGNDSGTSHGTTTGSSSSSSSSTSGSSTSNQVAEAAAITTCPQLQNFVWVRQGKTEHAAEYADGRYQVSNKFDFETERVVEHVYIQWRGTSRRDFVPARNCRSMYNDRNDQEVARSPSRTRKAPNRLGAWEATTTGRPDKKRSLAASNNGGKEVAEGGVCKKSRGGGGASVIVHPPPPPPPPPPQPLAQQRTAGVAGHPGMESGDGSCLTTNTVNVAAAAATTNFGNTETTTQPLLPLSRRCRSRAIAKKSLATSLLTTTTPRRMQRLVTIETTMPQADCLVIDLTTPPSSTSTSDDGYVDKLWRNRSKARHACN